MFSAVSHPSLKHSSHGVNPVALPVVTEAAVESGAAHMASDHPCFTQRTPIFGPMDNGAEAIIVMRAPFDGQVCPAVHQVIHHLSCHLGNDEPVVDPVIRAHHVGGKRRCRSYSIGHNLMGKRPEAGLFSGPVFDHNEQIRFESLCIDLSHVVGGERYISAFDVFSYRKLDYSFLCSSQYAIDVLGLLAGGLRNFAGIVPAVDDHVQSYGTRDEQSYSEPRDSDGSVCSSPGRFLFGCFIWALGFAFMKLAFYVSDHWWGVPLLYVPLGFCSVLCARYGTNLSMGFIVAQKSLHSHYFSYYNKCMSSVLPIDGQIEVISSLCEGSSIRSIERQTGIHRDTVMRLGVRIGQGCTRLMDAKMRNLECTRLEMDEIWGYIGKKDKHVRIGDDSQMGNVWTFCAIDADTKLVPAFHVAKERDVHAASAFVNDVASRMNSRLQISTDGLAAYVEAIEKAFGEHNVDYGQIIKTYGTEESIEQQRRYSAPKIKETEKKAVFRYPDWGFISTSYVERLNATTRLHMKRLARLTHAFSKKRENFEAAVGLHFAYYNFVRRHNTLRCTPAMAAGVEQSFWSVGELVEAAS